MIHQIRRKIGRAFRNIEYGNSLIMINIIVWMSLVYTGCSKEECAEGNGESCTKICSSTGEVAICVAPSICECVMGPSSGGVEGGISTGGHIGGHTGGNYVPPADCLPPREGQLMINEVMIDAEGNENTFEFVEIANLSEQKVRLADVVLTYNGTEKVVFSSGCMEP